MIERGGEIALCFVSPSAWVLYISNAQKICISIHVAVLPLTAADDVLYVRCLAYR